MEGDWPVCRWTPHAFGDVEPDRLADVLSQPFWVKLHPRNLVERFNDESSGISMSRHRPGCLAGVRCSSKAMNRLSSRCHME